MQQSSFKKEGMQHYMIMSPKEQMQGGYVSQLLQFHEVPYILPFECRTMNGEPLLYYRLRYRTSLKALLPHLPFTKKQLYNILKSIVGVLETAEEYLLPEEGLLFESDSVFIEADTGRLQFCYMPGRRENENSLSKLLTELMQAVDKKDEETVLLLLQFYNLVTEPDCTLAKLKNYVQRKCNSGQEYERREPPEELELEEPEPIVVRTVKEPEKEDRKLARVGFFLVGLAVVNILLILGLLCNILTYEAMRYLFVSMGLLIVTAIIFMNMQKEESPEEIMQAYFEEQSLPDVGQEAIDKEDFVEEKKTGNAEKATGVYGETTILTGEPPREEIVVEEEEQHLYLESLEQGKYEPIHIKNSVVLGCMAEGCSYILKDRGISRMHAKLMEKADGLYLLDLNSTNGTYLNGELLESGEDYKIEAGDHIAFAKSEFYVAVEAG